MISWYVMLLWFVNFEVWNLGPGSVTSHDVTRINPLINKKVELLDFHHATFASAML